MSDTFTTIVTYILSKVPDTLKSDVQRFLENSNPSFDEKLEIGKAESYLEWAKRLNYIKLVTASVPDFILPKNCSGELIDVKVFSRRGPDDKIYDAYPKVRERVARGNCFLDVSRGTHRGPRCVLYALKKFTGGLGDDDDRDKGDNHTWKRYFSQSLENAQKIVATKKANGEAAHLSCIEIDGHKIICAGSKNVHMLIRNREDISHYRESRYTIASEICHCVMDCLEEMETEQKDRLLEFLITTRYTGVFEILAPQHQHVEDLSYLERAIMQFITWTTNEIEPDESQKLCTVPPHIGIEIARALGLKTVDYDLIPATDVDARMKQIRKGYQFEGEVLYFLDANNIVFGLLKKKTVWYIICRAIREKAKHASSDFVKNKSQFSEGKVIKKIEKRLDDIQSWIGLSDEALTAWKSLGVGFTKWLLSRIETGELIGNEMSDKFPILWKEYLSNKSLTDDIPVECCEPVDEQDAGAVGDL